MMMKTAARTMIAVLGTLLFAVHSEASKCEPDTAWAEGMEQVRNKRGSLFVLVWERLVFSHSYFASLVAGVSQWGMANRSHWIDYSIDS